MQHSPMNYRQAFRTSVKSPMLVVDWILTFQSNVLSSCLRVKGCRRRQVTQCYIPEEQNPAAKALQPL